MMDKNRIYSYFPDNFADKTISEPFIAFIMSKYLKIGLEKWRTGNPNAGIPDYVVDDRYYEFTIASDRAKINLIRKLQCVTYSSDNVAKDAWRCIQESLDAKMKKHYSVNNVSLCILCLIDFTESMLCADGSMSVDLFRAFHSGIYNTLNGEYVTRGLFQNIYIILPFSNETWWVMDIVNYDITPVCLSETEIKSGKYPFFSKNDEYYNYFNGLLS